MFSNRFEIIVFFRGARIVLRLIFNKLLTVSFLFHFFIWMEMQSYRAWIYSPSRLTSTERVFLKIETGGSSQVRDASFNGYGLHENETGIRRSFYMHMYKNKYHSYKTVEE